MTPFLKFPIDTLIIDIYIHKFIAIGMSSLHGIIYRPLHIVQLWPDAIADSGSESKSVCFPTLSKRWTVCTILLHIQGL